MRRKLIMHNAWKNFLINVKTMRFAIFCLLFLILCLRENWMISQFINNSKYAVSYTERVLLLVYSGMGMPYITIVYFVLAGDFREGLPVSSKHEYKLWVMQQLILCVFYATFAVVMSIILSLILSIQNPVVLSGWHSQENLSNGATPLFSPILMEAFSPVASIIVSSIILWCFWILTAGILLLFSTLNIPVIGILLWGSMLFTRVIISTDTPSNFLPDRRFTLLSITEFSRNIVSDIVVTIVFMLVLFGCIAAILLKMPPKKADAIGLTQRKE